MANLETQTAEATKVAAGMDWLSSFFHDGFATASVLGLGAFAMLVIVALVALVAALSKGSPLVVFVIATLSVLLIVVLYLLFPKPQVLTRWFDTGLQADWGGKDTFYGAGQFPIYEANGIKLCNDDLLGRVVTCWSSRPADGNSMATGVPTNIKEKRNDWCAYKDANVTLARAPDGGAPPGRVYACAHSIVP